MNSQNRDDDNYKKKEQGYYEYRDPGKDREDDGRYVYQDDYGNEKNLGLRMLPLLLLIIAGMAVFIVINRDVDSFKLLMNESEPEVTTTEETTATTEDKSLRGDAIMSTPKGGLTFYGAKDGSTVNAYSNWVQVTENADIANFFESQDINYEIIMMALQSDYGRFVIEKYDAMNSRDDLDVFLLEMKTKSETEGVDATIQYLDERGFTSLEMAYIEEYIRGAELPDEDMDRLMIEYNMQEWMYEEFVADENFEYVTTFDIVVNEKIAPVYDYIYHGEGNAYDGVRTYESLFVEGSNLYRLSVWGWNTLFQKHVDEYINMFESFKPGM